MKINETLENIKEINTQLEDIATLNSSQYKIVGDGTDETSKLTMMFNDIPANGARLIFDRNKEITINGTSLINIIKKQNVVIEGLKAKGDSEAVIQVRGGSNNITFRDCSFKDFSQVIYLFDCEQITVDNCTFDNTGYGVIQKYGYSSSNVKVINCTAKNMKKDFVEANCGVLAPSKNWTISHNHYLGGNGYPTSSTEERFVGITAVKNVIISHNIIENVCGDSAIHLEDVGGNIIIDNNIIDNVVGATNNSYIWIISNEKTALIEGNLFLRSDSNLTKGIVYATSNTLNNNVKFVNNIVRGKNKNLDGINLANHKNFSIVGNTFEDLDKALAMSFTSDIFISSNEFLTNNYDIFANNGAIQGSCNDIQIIGNKSNGAVISCIEVMRNTSGTASSNRWLIEGNVFSNNAIGKDTIDFTCIGNVIANGKTIDFGLVHYSGSTGYVSANNRINGINAIINQCDRIFYGVTPVIGDIYIKNDKIINTNPTPAGYTGQICTVAGAYATMTWEATTSYTTVNIRIANGNVYKCAVAGISGTIAPSHTSGTSVDGTVTWLYLGALAVFKGYGTIQS